MPYSPARSISPATMNSIVPLGASGERRITSREIPVRPHGTNESKPTICPSAACADTSRHRPSAGSPRRFRAIEKPRSTLPCRHWSAYCCICFSSWSLRSRWRRMRRLYPAFRTRWQACRTCVSDVLFRLNLSVVSTASSPMRVMLSPSLAKARAPASLTLIAAGTHP